MNDTKVAISLDICVDCLWFYANGRPESVEPSWCPEDHNNYHRGYLDRPGEPACEGTCEESFTNFLAAIDGELGTGEVTLGSTDCEWCADSEEDCEPWFSMSSCDSCGSHLGGNRVHATLWKETTT